MKRKQNYADRFLPINVSPYQNVGNWEDPGKMGHLWSSWLHDLILFQISLTIEAFGHSSSW